MKPPLRPALLAAALAALPTAAEDSDQFRWYLDFRAQDTNPGTDVHDAWGASVGFNLNRWLGFEFAADIYELDFDPGGQRRGEVATWGLIPQARLRWPLWRDRLVPYLLAGGGVGVTQFNDQKPIAFGQDIEIEETMFLGSVGGGVEYYIADNLAIGFQVKYLLGGDQEYRIDGVAGDFSVDAPLTMLSIRVLGPQLRPQEFADLQPTPPTRLYFGPRIGGALPADRSIGPGLRWTPEPNSLGDWNQAFGLFFGASFGPHFALELSGEVMEGRLEVDGYGTIGEIGTYNLMPLARWRFPLRGGRVAPYAVAGVGLALSEFNDRREAGADVDVDESTTGLAATVGGGVEWFALPNLAAFAEARYVFHRGTSIRLDGGPERDMDLDSINLQLGVRIFFADFHRKREQPVR